MNIIDKTNKEERQRKEDYIRDIEETHNTNNMRVLKNKKNKDIHFATDEFTQDRSNYIDEYGNGRSYYISKHLYSFLVDYLTLGNTIEYVKGKINFKDNKLWFTDVFYNTTHEIRVDN